jgi:hypothetical protein
MALAIVEALERPVGARDQQVGIGAVMVSCIQFSYRSRVGQFRKAMMSLGV